MAVSVERFAVGRSAVRPRIAIRARLRAARRRAAVWWRDLAAIAGVACVAVGSSYVAPALPWFVAGLYLMVVAGIGPDRRAPR